MSRVVKNMYLANIELEKVREQEANAIRLAEKQAKVFAECSIAERAAMVKELNTLIAGMMVSTHEVLRKTAPVFTTKYF